MRRCRHRDAPKTEQMTQASSVSAICIDSLLPFLTFNQPVSQFVPFPFGPFELYAMFGFNSIVAGFTERTESADKSGTEC